WREAVVGRMAAARARSEATPRAAWDTSPRAASTREPDTAPWPTSPRGKDTKAPVGPCHSQGWPAPLGPRLAHRGWGKWVAPAARLAEAAWEASKAWATSTVARPLLRPSRCRYGTRRTRWRRRRTAGPQAPH